MNGVTITDEQAVNLSECRVPTTTIELSTLDNIKGVIESFIEKHMKRLLATNK